MFPEVITGSLLFGVGLTVIAYAACELLCERLSLTLLPPFVPACALIIALLCGVDGLSYESYQKGADFINFLLGPATIALALPLYRQRRVVQENLRPIACGILLATVVAVCCLYFCGRLLGTSEPVLLSLLPKSVTTPIAIEVSKTLGGIPALTTACVIMTGTLGATFNHRLLRLCGITNDIAAGLAIGASSHGLGVSACANVSSVQLALGSVAIALTGVATSILAPLLLPLLQSIF